MGVTARIITTPDADIAEDQTVTSAGTYSATAPNRGSSSLAGSCRWRLSVPAGKEVGRYGRYGQSSADGDIDCADFGAGGVERR